MKIFVDIANINEVKVVSPGVLCGVTTNVSLAAKEV